MARSARPKNHNVIMFVFSILIAVSLASPIFFQNYPMGCHGLTERVNRYDLTYRIAKSPAPGSTWSSFQSYHSDYAINGQLEVSSLSHDDQTDRSLWSIKLSQLSIQGDLDPFLLSSLEVPFQIVLNKDCSIEKYGFSDAIPESTKLILQNLTRIAEFTFEEGRTRWTSDQQDSSGDYLAKYESSDDGLKTILSKTRLNSKENAKGWRAIVAHSFGEASYNRYLGYFDSIEYGEHLQFAHTEHSESFAQRTEISIMPQNEALEGQGNFVADIQWTNFQQNSEPTSPELTPLVPRGNGMPDSQKWWPLEITDDDQYISSFYKIIHHEIPQELRQGYLNFLAFQAGDKLQGHYSEEICNGRNTVKLRSQLLYGLTHMSHLSMKTLQGISCVWEKEGLDQPLLAYSAFVTLGVLTRDLNQQKIYTRETQAYLRSIIKSFLQEGNPDLLRYALNSVRISRDSYFIDDLQRLLRGEDPRISHLAYEAILEMNNIGYLDLAISHYLKGAERERVHFAKTLMLSHWSYREELLPYFSQLYDSSRSFEEKKFLLKIAFKIAENPRSKELILKALQDKEETEDLRSLLIELESIKNQKFALPKARPDLEDIKKGG